MAATAYLLMLVRDDSIVGFSIFSEHSPTLIGSGKWLVLAEQTRPTYDEAMKVVASVGPDAGRSMGPRCRDALAELSANPTTRGVRVAHEFNR
jgi:hypothetical protein